MKVYLKILLYMLITIVISYILCDALRVIEGNTYKSINQSILADTLKYSAMNNQSAAESGKKCCGTVPLTSYPNAMCIISRQGTIAEFDISCNDAGAVYGYNEGGPCWYYAAEKHLVDSSGTDSIPLKYFCPSGGELWSNICPSTGGACTDNINMYTPESVHYPIESTSILTTDAAGYIWNSTYDADASYNYSYDELLKAPVLF